jgi:hypothetical protein
LAVYTLLSAVYTMTNNSLMPKLQKLLLKTALRMNWSVQTVILNKFGQIYTS